MLRKHNKLIMLLVLVTFMFTMVGSAGAASFSDVTGTSVEAQAVYRLSGLGVLDGYPDGTFGPEKTITRAEFAKIACVTAGLKAVASGMGGTASPFSDVATDHWANGWINVAAAQGFVKGDPAGTFRPEDQIKQAEVITVLLRLLGYNDNLPGEWPSDYISKAANLGVLDDITFAATQAATRGVVSVLASATLDESVVQYKASDNIFEEAKRTYDKGDGLGKISQSYSLLFDKFKESAKFKNALAIQFRYNSDGETYLEYFQYNDDQDAVIDPATGKVGTGANAGAVAANLIEKKLAKNCVFSGGGSILTVIENFVEFDVNDDGDISGIVVKDYAPVGPKLNATTILNEVKVESGKAKADGKTYSFLPRAQVVMESIFPMEFTAAGSGFADGTFNNSDAYRLILNKNGKVAGLRGYTFPTPGIVEKVIGDRIYYMDNATPLPVNLGGFESFAGKWTGFSSQGNFSDEDIYVQRDGKPAKLADIQPLDTVSVLQGYRGTDYYVIATSLKIPGKLQSAEYDGADVKKVKVMDLKWTIPYANFNFLGGAPKSYTARYSVDNGAEFESKMTAATVDTEYDLWNTDVKVLTSVTGKVAGLIFGEAASASKMYGVITEITTQMAWNDGTTVRNIKLIKSDGEKYNYPIYDDTYIKVGAASKKIKDLASLNTIDDTIMSKDANATTITPALAGAAGVEKLVSVSLKSSGLVDRIEVINQNEQAIDNTKTGLDTDNYLVKIGGTWVDAKNVVVFNLNKKTGGPATTVNDLKDTKVAGWTEFKNATGNYSAWYVNSNNKLEYVVINSAALSTGDKYAIFKEAYSASDKWVVFVGQDPIKRGNLVANATKGDVVHYTMSGSEADVDARTIPYGTTSNVAIEKISGNTIVLDTVDSNGKTSYKTDKDTVYFDVKKDTSLQVLDGVAVGDKVIVIKDAKDSDLAAAVVVVAAPGSVAPPAAVKASATITGSFILNASATDKFAIEITPATGEVFGDYSIIVYNADKSILKVSAPSAAKADYLATALGIASPANQNKTFDIKVVKNSDGTVLATKAISTSASY